MLNFQEGKHGNFLIMTAEGLFTAFVFPVVSSNNWGDSRKFGLNFI